MKELIHKSKNNSGTLLLSVALFSAVVVLPSLRSGAMASRTALDAAAQAGVERRNRNAFAQILGEVRATAADVMFVKTERYMHDGIGYAEHLKLGAMARGDNDLAGPALDIVHQESLAEIEIPDNSQSPSTEDEREGDEGHEETGEVGESDGHEGHNHSVPDGAPTIIRTADRDFRGFLGALEREVKPWRVHGQSHGEGRGAELLPWYRMMTLANPQFIRGYRLGAMWLGFDGHEAEAIEFLEEGVAKNQSNPELFQLHLSLAITHLRLIGEGTGPHHGAALTASSQGLERALAVRPEDGRPGRIRGDLLWTEDHEEDFIFLARFVSLLLENAGQFDEAAASARRTLAAGADDAILRNLADRLERGESAYAPGEGDGHNVSDILGAAGAPQSAAGQCQEDHDHDSHHGEAHPKEG